jgi:glycosyltransferase involved in cell wall biosynthesis
MLSGTPVVAGDIPGAREVVTRTGMGRLCAPGDPQALADALIEVAQQRPRYLRSRDTVRAIYDPVRAIDDYEALLREIVA